VFNALAAEEGQLQGLITNGNETFEALASRDEALSQTFEVLPTFLRETRTTLRRLDRFAANTRPLVNDLKGPADDLGPTVRDLGEMSPHLTRTLRDFNPLIRASRRGLPAASRILRGLNPVVDATHLLMPELTPVLADLTFNAQRVASFLNLGGGALAADGSNSYADDRRVIEHRLPQIALIDNQSFRQANSRPPDDRGLSYPAPNAYERAGGFGMLESGDCDNVGGGQRDPDDGSVIPLAPIFNALFPTLFPDPLAPQVGASPPCFVQPPSLFQGQQFNKLERGKVNITEPPEGRSGTRPATP
jgi:phospholipid/cholesterol/gamma-HCH transport system substrate-binding protein